MVKICKKCKKEKNLSEFYKNKSYKDRIDYYCKECRRIASHKIIKIDYICNYDCFNCQFNDCKNSAPITKKETEMLKCAEL